MTHLYSVYGLTVASEVPIPELSPGTGPADAVISYGAVPDGLPGAHKEAELYQVAPGRVRLELDGIGKYLISDGREIVVEPAPGSEAEAVRVVLLGSAMGGLLLQRGVLPLHASAIEVDGRCVAFTGPSGHGKSTLAAAFHRRGYRVVTDDVLAVRLGDGGGPVACAAHPELKLWGDSLAELEMEDAPRRRIPVLEDKSRLRIGDPQPRESLPLARLYVLEVSDGDRFELEAVTGAGRLEAVVANTYRWQFLDGLERRTEHFRVCLAVGRHVPVRRVRRPRNGFRLDELTARIERDFRESATAPGKPGENHHGRSRQTR